MVDGLKKKKKTKQRERRNTKIKKMFQKTDWSVNYMPIKFIFKNVPKFKSIWKHWKNISCVWGYQHRMIIIEMYSNNITHALKFLNYISM